MRFRLLSMPKTVIQILLLSVGFGLFGNLVSNFYGYLGQRGLLKETGPTSKGNKVGSFNKSPRMSITWGEWKETQPWPEDSECSVYRTRIAVNGSIPSRALASYPGSGNTWSRLLIESATGLFTGAIFNSSNTDISFGEVREWNDGSTIAQKTHQRTILEELYMKYEGYQAIDIYDNLQWRKDHVAQFGGRAIVIVRNPFKCVISYWTFLKTGSQTEGLKDKDSLLSHDFRYFALIGINRWLELITDWIEYGSEVYFLFYEDMVDNPVEEMRNLMDAVGIDVDEGRLKCMEKQNEGKFHRTSHVDTTNPYPVDHRQLFRNLIDVAAARLLEATGRTLPTHKYKYYSTEE